MLSAGVTSQFWEGHSGRCRQGWDQVRSLTIRSIASRASSRFVSEPLREAGVVRRRRDRGRLGWDAHAVGTVAPAMRREGGGSGLAPAGNPSRCDQSDILDPLGEERVGGPVRVASRSARPISKGLILAQNERWRRGLGMQVARFM